MKTSLAYTPSYMLETAPAEPKSGSKKKEEKPKYFPSISLEGVAAKKLMKTCKPGEEFTATVTFKCTGVSDRSGSSRPYDGRGGQTIDLEAQSIEIEGAEEPDSEDQSASEAIDSYRQGKK